ncbi:MAG: ABC transporter substrate-binding protein [Anaerolineaceae bacterium]|jgi:peptide/nickel transport system substrate-binding protein
MKKTKLVLVVLLLSLILSACGERTAATEPVDGDTAVPTVAPTLTPTAIPPRTLNVCMAQSPDSLYRYDGKQSLAKQSVFALLYPDLLSVDPQSQQAIFLESIPSQENGAVQLLDVQVKVGMPVQNASGQVVYLEEGTLIEHAVNYSLENPVAWSHEQDYHMNLFQITFKLRPELKWSDGSALTAEDFVYSYHLAEKAALGHDKWALDRTQSFVAEDEQTLVWTGVPGFVPENPGEVLWQPLPEQALENLSENPDPEQDVKNISPLSWGPYRIQPSSSLTDIQFEKNPFYIMGEGFSGYDLVNFQLVTDLATALEKLRVGECDILDKTYQVQALTKSELEEIALDARLIGEDWEPVQQLVFGIKPAVYDVGSYNAWTAERQDILGNVETRRALSACIDPIILRNGYFNAHLPESVVAPELNYVGETLDGNALLEEIGWIYPEEGTVRVAKDVPNVLDGSELRLSLVLGQSQMDQEVAEMIRASLERCGAAVTVQSLPVAQLYQPGPDGLIFGRQFDLALISWQKMHLNTCQLYTSDQVLTSANSWVGTNVAGFSDEAFDHACWASSGWLGGEKQGGDVLMVNYLPAIELLPQYRFWVVSNNVVLPELVEFTDIWQFLPGE